MWSRIGSSMYRHNHKKCLLIRFSYLEGKKKNKKGNKIYYTLLKFLIHFTDY